MNPVHVLMHVRENIFYFYLENRILGPPKVDHVTFTTSLNILPIEITLLQLLCFFAVKESSRVLTEPFASLLPQHLQKLCPPGSSSVLISNTSFNCDHRWRNQQQRWTIVWHHGWGDDGPEPLLYSVIPSWLYPLVNAVRVFRSQPLAARVILTSIVASTACMMINPKAMSTGPNSREMRTLCFWFPEP